MRAEGVVFGRSGGLRGLAPSQTGPDAVLSSPMLSRDVSLGSSGRARGRRLRVRMKPEFCLAPLRVTSEGYLETLPRGMPAVAAAQMHG